MFQRRIVGTALMKRPVLSLPVSAQKHMHHQPRPWHPRPRPLPSPELLFVKEEQERRDREEATEGRRNSGRESSRGSTGNLSEDRWREGTRRPRHRESQKSACTGRRGRNVT